MKCPLKATKVKQGVLTYLKTSQTSHLNSPPEMRRGCATSMVECAFAAPSSSSPSPASSTMARSSSSSSSNAAAFLEGALPLRPLAGAAAAAAAVSSSVGGFDLPWPKWEKISLCESRYFNLRCSYILEIQISMTSKYVIKKIRPSALLIRAPSFCLGCA